MVAAATLLEPFCTPEPILDGHLALRAREVLSDLSRALLRVDPGTIDDPWLSSGTAGLALAHAYLHAEHPQRGHEVASRRALRHAAASMSGRGSFHRGIAGVGWVVEHLGNDDARHDPNAQVDDWLLAALSTASDLPWTVLHGAAGVAVYALERGPRRRARALLDRIASRLIQSVRRDEHGAALLTDPVWTGGEGEPYFDLGFARGVPGAVATLAALVEAEVRAEEIRPLLADACAWLLAHRLDGEGDASFGERAGDQCAARSAWCHGDPGVAWALLLAARALGNASLERTATAVAVRAAARAPDETGVRDAGFCHGAAGLAHLFFEMHRATGNLDLLRGGRRWLARVLAMRSPRALLGFRFASEAVPGRWNDDPTLLTGAAGVALVLASALHPERAAWGASMLVSCAGR